MRDIPRKLLEEAGDQLRQRYSERWRKFGHDPRTLGWDTARNQTMRFQVASGAVAMGGKHLLDIGCGLGDFLTFLRAAPETSPGHYHGVDINPDLVQACRDRFAEGASFSVADLMTQHDTLPMADVVTLFGLLNLRFHHFDNEDFARAMITHAFSRTRECLVVDMLSARADAAYPREVFVYYYAPEEMLAFALTLTPHVTLRHDYPSIPQREFMLFLRKEPCAS